MAKKKSLPDIDTLRKNHAEVAYTLFNESDRGCILVGAAILEESLEMLFQSFFKWFPKDLELLQDRAFNGNVNISTFGQKIEWLKDTKHMNSWIIEDLRIIKSIRNKSAHTYEPFDINNPKIIKQLTNLKGPPEFAKTPEFKEIAHRKNFSTDFLLDDPKSRYIIDILYLSGMFFALYEETQKKDSLILRKPSE